MTRSCHFFFIIKLKFDFFLCYWYHNANLKRGKYINYVDSESKTKDKAYYRHK